MKEGILENKNQQPRIPPDLLDALDDLSNSNNPTKLQLFLRKENFQHDPFELSKKEEHWLHNFIHFNLQNDIEVFTNYKRVMIQWKLLKKAGLLTSERLQKEIQEFVTYSILKQDEIRETEIGKESYSYTDESVNSFIDNLKSNIKESLNWDVTISV